MKVILSNNRLEDILDYSEILKIFKCFSNITGIDVALHNIEGEETLSYRKDKSRCICTLVKSNQLCKDNMKKAAIKAAELGEPYIFKCGCVVKCSAPIIFNNKLIGSVACGPVLLWEADELVIEELKKFISSMSLSIHNLDSVVSYFKQLEPDIMTSAAQILFITVNTLSQAESKYLSERNRIYNQQRQIGDLIIQRKNYGSINSYTQDMGNKLITYVQTGDTKNAKRMLNDILGEIVTHTSGNLELFKAKLYELTASLMRAAVDIGAPLEEMSDYINYYTKILADNTTFEDLCHMTSEIMEMFIRVVYEQRIFNRNNKHLADAVNYIKNNYMEDISLNLVADKIFISGYYLSHLFRKELNMTFNDYLTKIRMDESIKLLKTYKLKVQEVAYSVGFKDANYFSKAFKKYYSMTPKQFMLSSQ